jgi:hypothetical protein
MIASTSGFVQTMSGIIVGLVVVGVPLLIRFLVKLYNGQKKIMDVLITPEPTPLVPDPAPGLVDIVAGLLRDSKPDDGTTGRDVLNTIARNTARRGTSGTLGHAG